MTRGDSRRPRIKKEDKFFLFSLSLSINIKYDTISLKEAKPMSNDNLYIKCNIEHPDGLYDKNMEDAQEIKEILYKHGIIFELDDEEISIYIERKTYNKINNRNAGRKRTHKRTPDGKDFLYYSDIVSMMQSMTDLEIMEYTKIPPATYNRHKKTMMQSPYYKRLDKNRLWDTKYLKSMELDQIF